MSSSSSSSSTTKRTPGQQSVLAQQQLWTVLWIVAAFMSVFGFFNGPVVLFSFVFTALFFIPSLFLSVFASSDTAELGEDAVVAASEGGFLSSLATLIIMVIIYYAVLFVLQFKYPAARNVLYKSQIFPMGVLIMAFSRDFKWKKPVPNPAAIKDLPASAKQTRRIVFIRHGESEWNEVFNRGMKGFAGRLSSAIIKELQLLTTKDSVFVDASLCEEGMEQGKELREFLSSKQLDCADPQIIECLRGDDDQLVQDSVIVASNLRRASGTAALGLRQRLHRTGEQVYLLSCLQEISRNVDANAISRPKEVPDLHVINHHMWEGFDPEKLFNAEYNEGQKSLLSSNGYKRMRDFCEWTFEQSKGTVIVGGGHSFYFRAFFQSFMDLDHEFIGKTNIMHNSAVVSFTLERGEKDGRVYYRIDPDVKVLYKGFKAAKK